VSHLIVFTSAITKNLSLLPTSTANMPPAANLPTTTAVSSTPHPNGEPWPKPQPSPAQTAILHRTPWIPPVAVRGEGVYLELEDGSRIIDGVGGAAVNCIGSGNPRVVKAIKDQLDQLACEYLV
jgi:4-aminobutyrate aminotransferase-like enzyme